MSILLLGEHGQVSHELQRCLPDLVVRGSAQLDLSDPAQIRQQVLTLRPRLIINAAAYTAVDQAESEPERAFAINADAPGVLAELAAELAAPLIHYSTDYVFDGSLARPYRETDTPNPLNVYGRSKLAGEQAIARVGGAHLILRTSWVYADHGRNFLLTLQHLLQTREQVSVVSDQIGAPTWAGSIAKATADLIQRWQAGQPGSWGVHHLTAQGETSWFGFAEAIGATLREAGLPCAHLLPISSAEYPTAAARPLNSRLDCSQLQADWRIQLPHWREGLTACLRQSA
ncbi:dTDP-4-dehydrorhamnose reductase [Pseudomonas spirodelae]|uniref:dTDP-4-dehydrorhamnose reductase n=1 Tax=Pseudomonas spirodelae TaxID=3101751 RepID=A0ABU5P4X4_9PSED|nr:dTDP-4-dehydrorhamnose reductase [Pseudomonas sp. T5W1]MEA1604697.1 dTDP-4-dehydrorhamnose reductase [Pseudomonas sp. T5W1]